MAFSVARRNLSMMRWITALLPTRSLEAELEEYERADPTRTNVLAWWAAAWLASLSVLRLLEAILFACVVVSVMFRFRASLRVIRAAVWSPPLFFVLCYLVWTAAATIVAGGDEAWRNALPERKFLIPVLLVPVLHRWRLLLLGLVAGGALEVIIMLARAAFRATVWPELSVGLADGTQWTLIVLVAAGGVAVVAAVGSRRLLGALFTCLALVLQGFSTQRAPFVGSLVALVSVVAVGWRFFSHRMRLAALIAASAMLASAVTLSVAGGGVAAKRIESLGDLLTYEKLNEYSSHRLELWRWTARAIIEDPVVGHGRRNWRATVDGLIDASPNSSQATSVVRNAREIGYSHNTVLDVTFESGVIGAGLLATAVILGLVGALRRLHEEPIAVIPLAAFAGLLCAAQFEFVFGRSIQGATVIAIATMVLMPRPSAAQWERSGLGRSDAWISRFFVGGNRQ